MTEQLYPNTQAILDEARESIERIKADNEGREATLAGIRDGLSAMRGGELAPHDIELLKELREDPIGAIRFPRALKQSGAIDA